MVGRRGGGALSGVSRSLHTRPLARIVALASALAAAGLWLGLPSLLVGLLAAPAFLGGASLGLLARIAPGNRSGAEVGLWAWLLSPALLTAVYGTTRVLAGWDGRSAASAALALAALAQLPAFTSRVAWSVPPRSARAALVAGAVLALVVLGAHALLPGLRLSEDGLWHAGLIAASERGLPPLNPWLAGTAARHAIVPHTLGALLLEVFSLPPTRVAVVLGTWAAASLPLALTLVADPVWRLGRRVALAVLLGLVGWNALAGWQAGWLWLVGSARPPSGAAGPLATLLDPGTPPLALAWALGAWASAAGALRHGQTLHIALCGLLAGLAFTVDPALGALAAAACALAAFGAPGTGAVRPALPLALLVGLAPGAWLLREGLAGTVAPNLPAPGWEVWVAGAGPLLAAALPLVRGVSRGGRPIAALLLSALPAGLLVSHSALPGASSGAVGALVGVALGLLAGGGLSAGLLEGGRLWRAFSLTAGVVLLGGGAAFVASLPPNLARAAAAAPELVETKAGLEPRARRGLSPDARAAYAWLRDSLSFRDRRPVLLLSELRETQRLPRVRRPHPAPLFSGLDLWCDRSEPMARAHPMLDRRSRVVRSFFELDGGVHTGPLREAERLDRPLIVWVEADDRLRAPGIEGQLERLRLALLYRQGQVALYVWPPELADAGEP